MYSNRRGEVGIFNVEILKAELIEGFAPYKEFNMGIPPFTFKPETGQLIFYNSRIDYFEIGNLLNIENENIYELTISPNPVQDELNISFQLENLQI